MLTCKTSGKSYVGQTKYTTERRWNEHVYEAKTRLGGCRKLNHAINKYEPDDFIIEDLLYCDEDELDTWEQFFIVLYDTFPDGLNLTPGGKSNQTMSDETRERISEATIGKPKNVKDNRKREADNLLPKYVKHVVCGNAEGYRVSDHPRLAGSNHTVTFSDPRWTMEEKFMMAMKVLDELNNGTYVQKKDKKPTGIQAYSCGYRVMITGHPSKYFANEKYTKEENLAMAIRHAKSITGEVDNTLKRRQKRTPL